MQRCCSLNYLSNTSEAKGRNAEHRDQNKNVGSNQDGCAENFSMSSSRSSLTEKDREELMSLREQVEDLRMKLLEKDELLKEAEILKNEMTQAYAELDAMKKDISEKDFSLKSTQVQLSDAQISRKVLPLDQLQQALYSFLLKFQYTLRTPQTAGCREARMGSNDFQQKFVQALTENDSRGSAEEYDVIPYLWDQSVEIDNLNEREMQKLEEAREAYIAAVVTAKENEDEACLSAAATARSYLQSLVLRT
ncbi:hypothetical protein RND71_026437 [Anisodus tanguticus]|uniref:Uncharacterized protein n=1 Tax=Anisodus tanguticus TaxID=243964 RepID=A0AAE1RNW6_9SOLA|nr:hypothetical protein RND71_026437 [Anisodus tanguticus]